MPAIFSPLVRLEYAAACSADVRCSTFFHPRTIRFDLDFILFVVRRQTMDGEGSDSIQTITFGRKTMSATGTHVVGSNASSLTVERHTQPSFFAMCCIRSFGLKIGGVGESRLSCTISAVRSSGIATLRATRCPLPTDQLDNPVIIIILSFP